MTPLDEASFLARVEAASSADELAGFFRRPAREEEKALRTYFGDARYQRLHAMALRRSGVRSAAAPLGNVVVLHGIMGSELSLFTRAGAAQHLWVNAVRVMKGLLGTLQLNEDGRSSANDVRPSGMMKRHYGELLLSLSDAWKVRAFWYDWRKSLSVAADELAAQLTGWFEDGAPVHLVAHSMGGLVARTFIKNHPMRWEAMRGPKGTGGRLVMLGTPNHGSFVIPQVIMGIEPLVRKLALLDLRHDVRALQRVFNSFPGLYEMLPSPRVAANADALYDPKTYGGLRISPRHLENARRQHERLATVVDPQRMVYVAGANRPTPSGISDFGRLGSHDAYDVTLAGDGRVPHELGRLVDEAGTAVATYYVDETHGDLAVNDRVLAALRDILEGRGSGGLPTEPPRDRTTRNARDARVVLEEARRSELEEVEQLVLRMGARTTDARRNAYVSYQERELEDAVTRGFLASSDEERRSGDPPVEWTPPLIELGIECCAIEDVHERGAGARRIDAVAVGHYVGVKPQEAERALDEAISRHLPGRRVDEGGELPEADMLLTQYTERGIIRGELGQPFFLDDPRPGGSGEGVEDRVIVVAGMGLPGRFGVPELTVLARELCWSLGRMGKAHLATVVIGAGNGNLDVRDAVDAWIRGLKHAITGSSEDEGRRLQRLTFVEYDARKIRGIQQAILAARHRLEGRLEIAFEPIPEEELTAMERHAEEAALEAAARAHERPRQPDAERPPTRLTLELDSGTYRFGAITQDASLPERAIALDPKLVAQANDELAGEWKRRLQHERGQLLERLLVPAELRPHLASDAPLVMLLDATTARVHWEMMAVTDASVGGDGAPPDDADLAGAFLGTSRGLTRQLRTTFAPPPEPPPPPRRLLSVLVVADPAEDAHLPGAEEEGVAVADLFEAFNTVYGEDPEQSRVKVVRLFGPAEATRTAVLRHLILRSYDVLHYAGHCVYDPDPSKQGWIFTGEELLSPNELNRIDRIPKFVFSNACESGITPDRSEERNVALAPSFAESFFQRGVSNFVCTAWPVNDLASRDFAVTMYARLLGLDPEKAREGKYERGEPKPMHVAMRDARVAIYDTLDGIRTWGAYQHYGNPYFHLFDPVTLAGADGTRKRERRSRSRPRRTAAGRARPGG